MSRSRMIAVWLTGGAVLTALFTAALGVFGRISILEHLAIFAGALLAIALLWLLYRALKLALK